MVQKAEYSRGMNSSSLILTAEKDYRLEKDSIEMFRYNKIPYFLDMKAQRKNIRQQFCYDITSKRSLEQMLDYKTLDFPLLQKILYSFDQACMQAGNYMLAENDILLDSELIFYDSETERILYCYLPANQVDICRQFQEFMEYLLQRLDHKDEQAVQLAYGVYQRAAEEGTALHTVLTDIRKGTGGLNITKQLEKEYQQNSAQNIPLINQYTAEERMSEKAMQQPLNQHTDEKRKPQKAMRAPVNQQAEEKRKPEKAVQPQKSQQKEASKKQAAEKFKGLLRKKLYTDGGRNVEEELVFESDAEEEFIVSHPTVCLMPETEGIQNQFIYQGTDRTRDFHCMEGKMILGSSSQESDICIPLPMVSRVHARVEVGSQGTFLEDMNSTNGTQVNGELLKYRERRMLQKGDIISLAGENYSFH